MKNLLRPTVGAAVAAAAALAVVHASAGEVPKRLVFTSYDFGSSGFAQASGIANAFKQVHNTRIRIVPSGTSIGRILPLAQRKADYAFLASGTYFASEGTYDFATPNWGPQNLRCVMSPPAGTGIVMLGNSKFSAAEGIKGMRLGYVKGNPSVNVKTDGIAAFAGLLYAARVGAVRGDVANGFELDIITIVLLGGVSIFGGTGSLIGTLLAILIVLNIRNGMALLNITGHIQTGVIGLLLIASVIVPRLKFGTGKEKTA